MFSRCLPGGLRLHCQATMPSVFEYSDVVGTGGGMAMAPRDADMDQGMARLRTAKGAEADRLFLELMITHHASALMLGHTAMGHLTDPQLKASADSMFAKQARQIGELQRLREATRTTRR